MAQETQIWALYQPRGVDGVGDGREFQKGWDKKKNQVPNCSA